MEESGVTNVADPLGGSWYVEALTDKIEAEAERIFERIRAMAVEKSAVEKSHGEKGGGEKGGGEEGGGEKGGGEKIVGDNSIGDNSVGEMTRGILRGIEDGWFMAEIADASFAYQQALEKGSKKVVGVNVHTATVAPELEILRISHEVEREQCDVLARRRAQRDQAVVTAAIERMVEAANAGVNLVPSMMDACRAEATLGEICDALRAIWGGYREPARF
jgi:methylmalonyl-CoA mutase N-terminal domain/subunit